MSDFVLHAQLAKDTLPVQQLSLCDCRLLNDARFVWCVLIPRCADLTELMQLDSAQWALLAQDINRLSAALLTFAEVRKINVGALGNLVPQLHIHVVGRAPGDAAWPGPVWGHEQPLSYVSAAAAARCETLRQQLSTAS